MFATRTPFRASDVVIRAAIVGLALATGYIHSTLGGLLFTLNAVGYAVAAIAMVIPLALAVRFRWFVRLGLIGYAATTLSAGRSRVPTSRRPTSPRPSRSPSSRCSRSTSRGWTGIPSRS